MRISDWSSDVCSSDLAPRRASHCRAVWPGCLRACFTSRASGSTAERDHHPVRASVVAQRYQAGFDFQCAAVELAGGDAPAGAVRIGDLDHVAAAAVARSEEHTSELQSLMRISYAVFCLK